MTSAKYSTFIGCLKPYVGPPNTINMVTNKYSTSVLYIARHRALLQCPFQGIAIIGISLTSHAM